MKRRGGRSIHKKQCDTLEDAERPFRHMLHWQEGLGVGVQDDSPPLRQAVGDVGNVTHLLTEGQVLALGGRGGEEISTHYALIQTLHRTARPLCLQLAAV